MPDSASILTIGIVGPPAGGKSTVAAALAELGAAWINADRLAHYSLRLGSVKESLHDYFGDSVLDPSGAINRKHLASRVFGDDPTNRGALEYIESVIHPIVFEMAIRRVFRLQRSGFSTFVMDAPLLIEAGWHYNCDEIWFVDAPVDLRREWIKRRGWSEQQLAERESRQLSLDLKKHHSTRIIDNRGELGGVIQQVAQLWNQLTTSAID